MRLRALLCALTIACEDKSSTDDSGPVDTAHTGETGAPEDGYACSGLTDAIGAVSAREPDLELFFPDADCEAGIWSFEGDASRGDVVADAVWVLPWDQQTGVLGSATALTDDGTGLFTGELPSSETGFSCDAEIQIGWIFAPMLGESLGVLSGMGARGAASGAGWGSLGGGDFGFEVATNTGEVAGMSTVACNPVTGKGFGPQDMISMGPSEDYSGADLWALEIDLESNDLGEASEVLLGALGVDAAGTVNAAYYGGG